MPTVNMPTGVVNAMLEKNGLAIIADHWIPSGGGPKTLRASSLRFHASCWERLAKPAVSTNAAAPSTVQPRGRRVVDQPPPQDPWNVGADPFGAAFGGVRGSKRWGRLGRRWRGHGGVRTASARVRW